MSTSLADLTPDTQAAVDQLLNYAHSIGLDPRVTFTSRTCDEQNQLYAIGRTILTDKPKVTYAKGCYSWHVQRRAVDISLPGGTQADYAKLGDFWKSIKGYWGGDFPGFADLGHFEYHPGVHIEQVCPDPANCVTAPYPGMTGTLDLQLTGIRAAAAKGVLLTFGIAAAVVVVGLQWRKHHG